MAGGNPHFSKWLILLIVLLASHLSPAQRMRAGAGSDTIYVKGKTFLLIRDSTIYVKNDTVLYLPDSVIAKLRKDRQSRSDEGYEKLREKLSKKKWTRELHSFLFRSPSSGKTSVKARPAYSAHFDRYEGKIIRSVRIKRLDPFGTRVTDTTRTAKDWFSRAGNKVHINTREFIIRNNLFFKPGDKVNGYLLQDSERILRGLPFVRDARVYIISGADPSQVDILVITRDIWNISGSVSYSGSDDFGVTLIDKNFLGLGYELENEFSYDAENSPKLGYGSTYTANNIFNTFIVGEATYARFDGFDKHGINFYRNFITPDIKYAGGLEIAQERRTLSRVFEDTTLFFDNRKNIEDYWFGRSFLIKEDESGRTNFQVALSYKVTKHLDRPVVTKDTNQNFHSGYLKLLSMGLSKRRFERSSLVLGYGRTEDIPIGYLAEVTIGRDENEFTNRTYAAVECSLGQFFDRFGYLRSAFSFGSFIENKKAEQGVLNLRFNYFSYLYRWRRTSFRQFVNMSYVKGINRFSDEFININDENGIRGLSNVFLRGTEKITFNTETVAFTSLFFIGFRMALFGFADVAWINDRSETLFSNKPYTGYGLGIRFRNENLAFSTIQIRVGWYPRTPPDVSGRAFTFSGEQNLSINDFRLNRSRILPFR